MAIWAPRASSRATVQDDAPATKPGAARTGIRFGTIGCFGCGTFVVLALAVFVLVVAIAAHG